MSVIQSVNEQLSHSFRFAKETAPTLYGLMQRFEMAENHSEAVKIQGEALEVLTMNECALWCVYVSKKFHQSMTSQAKH